MSCLKSSTHICGHNEAVPWLQRYEKDICSKQLDLPVILSIVIQKWFIAL